jgi:sulfur-carrier protein
MSVRVFIPTPFRRATHNRDTVESGSPDIRRLLEELEASFDGLRGLLRNDAGEVHHHINIYVNSEAIETQQGLDTPLRDGDEVAIIPAMAGGADNA